MTIEEIIAKNLAGATTTGRTKATPEDFAKFVVLEGDVVRVNAIDIYKDEHGQWETVRDNIKDLLGLIGYELKEKGSNNGDKPAPARIDVGKLLKK